MRKPPREPGPPIVTIGRYSQQDDRTRASIGASVRGRQGMPGDDRDVGWLTPTRPRRPVDVDRPNPYPPLRADSSFAQNPEPLGPGSFWYTPGPGLACPYAPGTLAPCYTLLGPGAPAADPTALAAAVADRLPLLPGRIRTSPQATGLTGAVSWFWLDPGPTVEEVTVTLAGESVTVTAEPSVIEWRPGDGTRLLGGPGIPYRSGPPPEGAIVHIYETRCLPGDEGRNPYVLGSCGSNGYLLQGIVTWRISFTASGPIDTAGSLPARMTAAEAPFPVSESRAFLLAEGSQ